MTDPLELIMRERVRQDRKWGPNRTLDDFYWLGILTEEIGEVAKAILENRTAVDGTPLPYGKTGAIRNELVETAAVALAWLEDIERRRPT